MNPDDYEPRRHVYREWEGEVTLDRVDYLVIGCPVVESFPVQRDGKLAAGHDYSFEGLGVYPVLGDTYDYDSPLRGAPLADWRKTYEATIAERACEEQQDRADREREERMYE